MSNRREQRMLDDIGAVIAACEADATCPFTNFQTVARNFSFDYTQKNGKVFNYNFVIGEDYPENTVVTCSEELSNSTVTSERIPIVFNQISREKYRHMNIVYVSVVQYVESDDDDDDDDEEEENEDEGNMNRFVSVESTATDATNDSWEAYGDYSDDEVEGSGLHTMLIQDLQEMTTLYGESSLDYRIFDALGDIDIDVKINLSFLNEGIARAWRLLRNEPIVIRLHMSFIRYLDGLEPKIEVFQPSQKENFGVGIQLKKIVECFLHSQWERLSNQYLQSQYSHTVNFTRRSPKAKIMPSASVAVDDQKVARLLDMGFESSMAHTALTQSKGCVEEAINLLINFPDKLNRLSTHSQAIQQFFSAQTVPSASSSGSSEVHADNEAASTSEQSEGLFSKMKSLFSSASPKGIGAHFKSAKPKTGKESKCVPPLSHGFLVQFTQYVQQRLLTLNEFCVVCDETHIFVNDAMLKPTVCARELCVFAFQTLGVMSNAADAIATSPEVVNLLIAMARTACRSPRQQLVFNPYPTVVDPKNPGKLAFDPKKKQFQKAELVLNSLTPASNMVTSSAEEIKKKLDGVNILAYPFLEWIINSNRSHIMKQARDKQLEFMNTQHQFILLSSPPAKEAAFCQAKQQYGSTFAFHGSGIENWHSIMRLGLLNASGTKYQINGAAHGKGIYLSPTAALSMTYCRTENGIASTSTGRQGNCSKFIEDRNTQLWCIALCEVVTSPELKINGKIWVCANPDHVCTRLFFVYENGMHVRDEIDTRTQLIHAKILQAVSN